MDVTIYLKPQTLFYRGKIMQDISTQLDKKDNETWEQCINRLASRYHLQEDVRYSYNKFLNEGMTQAHAAIHACYEWDVLPRSKPHGAIKETVKEIIKKNI
jgi:hypothetical protein